ncbi:MAG TPA: MraY family glycosyltransferase [Actinomycetota bacterium]|jgi:UDP-GlcNAc:undecaprenyl-phosphate GlcNAc-1-phosphate transferase
MPFLVALACGVVLVPLARAAGATAGIVDRPGALKIHAHPIPLTGGVAVVASTILAVAIFAPAPHAAVLGGIGGALALGTVDDVRPLSAWLRVGLLGCIAIAIVAGGVELEPLGVLGGAGLVVGAVLCANAVNVMDGQDALAGGLVVVAALGLAAVAGLTDLREAQVTGLALAGGTLAFLWWNRPPASVFLGNGGAYAVGFTLAVLAGELSRDGWRNLAAAVVVLGVFAFEVVMTLARRAVARGSLTGGDRKHSYDLISARRGRARAAITMWVAAALAALLGIAVATAPIPVAAGAGGLALLLGAVAGRWLWAHRALAPQTD